MKKYLVLFSILLFTSCMSPEKKFENYLNNKVYIIKRYANTEYYVLLQHSTQDEIKLFIKEFEENCPYKNATLYILNKGAPEYVDLVYKFYNSIEIPDNKLLDIGDTLLAVRYLSQFKTKFFPIQQSEQYKILNEKRIEQEEIKRKREEEETALQIEWEEEKKRIREKEEEEWKKNLPNITKYYVILKESYKTEFFKDNNFRKAELEDYLVIHVVMKNPSNYSKDLNALVEKVINTEVPKDFPKDHIAIYIYNSAIDKSLIVTNNNNPGLNKTVREKTLAIWEHNRLNTFPWSYLD